MKKIIFLLAVGFAGYFGYQKYFSNKLYGEWQLDTEAMSQQLTNAGVSQNSIDAFRKQMGNGRTTSTISKEKIAFTINGERVDFAYQAIGRNGNCTTIKFEDKTLDYCVKGNTLEVHNQRNAMFEVYKRL
jgi:hypothetical protein